MRALLIIISCCFLVSAAPTTAIKVDQVGYLPDAPKLAFVVAEQTGGEFLLRKVNDASVVFRGQLSTAVADADSRDRVQVADFSTFRTAGKFYLEVPGIGTSWSFSIGPNVYERAYYLTMRAFYGQRCGTAVDLGPEFPGYKHAACHLTGAYHATSGKSGAHVSTKGWHDAGDYGRYIVNSGISTGELLWAWEMFGPRIKKISLNIPESKNSVPDILDEIRWNLDWMLTMQDDDGGVWHKQTSEQFAAFVKPEDDKLVSYVIGTGKEPYKNSTATADFAAVMAIAARVYKPFDANFSQQCLKAAEKAWGWLQKYPNVSYRNALNIETGDYGDADARDELLWAAAELWRTSRKDEYEQYFLVHYSEQVPRMGPPGWPRVAPMALWTYMLDGGAKKDVAATIREATLKSADDVVARTSRNAYRQSLVSREYVWGSNAIAANYGVELLIANAVKPDARYVETALENLHYLLGRNTFSLSWVTQLGEHPFRHPHHRPSETDSNPEPWPGMLSGGPNQHRQDPAMKKLGDLPPAKMYLDEVESYASNEICINWNAPLVLLLAGLLPAQ